MRRVRREEGVVLVEFALVAGLLLLLCFGMIELGLVVNAKLVLAAAVREGARRAAVEGGATAAVRDKIEEQLRLGNIDPAEVEIRIVPDRASYGATIRVALEYKYPILLPLLQSVFGRSLSLQAEIVTRSERVRGP
ncbi:MAG: pilus assembly protein [bacterium]|nr:pilus assembly protein [bacterium]